MSIIKTLKTRVSFGIQDQNIKSSPNKHDFREIGNVVNLGQYQQERGRKILDIEWIVLDVQQEKSLLISRYSLDVKPFHEKFEDVTWETCSLRKWLNEVFWEQAFSDEEREMISSSMIHTDDNKEFGTAGGNDTYDKVFLLSAEEAERFLLTDDARKCMPTRYALSKDSGIKERGLGCWWWLRSPGFMSHRAIRVHPTGLLRNNGCFVNERSVAVRPAIFVKSL